MQNEQTKSLLVNVMTGVVIIGVLAAGYFVFTNQTQTTGGSSAPTSVSEIASETATIGTQIESTVSDLEDLTRAIASSTIIFSTPAFQNLQDFSVIVPSETVGRDNPFIPTDWKLKMSAPTNTAGLPVQTRNSAASSVNVQAQTKSPTSVQSSATSSSSLLGDFAPGI